MRFRSAPFIAFLALILVIAVAFVAMSAGPIIPTIDTSGNMGVYGAVTQAGEVYATPVATPTMSAVWAQNDNAATKGLTFNVPTSSTNGYRFQVNGVNQMSLSNGGLFNLPGLTASNVVCTDASKNLTTTSCDQDTGFPTQKILAGTNVTVSGTCNATALNCTVNASSGGVTWTDITNNFTACGASPCVTYTGNSRGFDIADTAANGVTTTDTIPALAIGQLTEIRIYGTTTNNTNQGMEFRMCVSAFCGVAGSYGWIFTAQQNAVQIQGCINNTCNTTNAGACVAGTVAQVGGGMMMDLTVYVENIIAGPHTFVLVAMRVYSNKQGTASAVISCSEGPGAGGDDFGLDLSANGAFKISFKNGGNATITHVNRIIYSQVASVAPPF